MRRGRSTLAVCAVLLLTLVGCAAQPAAAYPEPTERFFVNDYADVMTDAHEQAVYEAGVALYRATDAQVVLLTVSDLGGRSLEDYALHIARDWGIGDAEKNNGILLLFTADGPHSRIEVGYGLEGAVNDSKAGRILDTYLVPAYEDEAAWSAQLAATYQALLNEVYAEYGLTEQVRPVELPAPEQDSGGEVLAMFILLIVVLVLASTRRGRRILVFTGGLRGGGGFGGGGGFRSGGGGFHGGGGGFGGGGASR